MTKVILHIGQSKTGSTSLQITLRRNRDSLLAQGILYPEPQHYYHCHHAIQPLVMAKENINQSIINRLGYDRDGAIRLATDGWQQILREHGDTCPSTVILSSESLFKKGPPEEMARLKALLRQIGAEIGVLCYIRSPAQHYLSRAQQFLKVRAPLLRPEENPLVEVLDRYRTAFGDALECRVYDRKLFPNGDVIADFVRWVNAGTDIPLVASPDANKSISTEAMSVLNQLGGTALFPETRDADDRQKKLFALVQTIDGQLPGATKPRLRPQIVDHLTRTNPDLLRLRDDYGLVFHDVDYGIVGKTEGVGDVTLASVDQICAFDTARRDELKARVLQGQRKSPVWRRVLRRFAPVLHTS